MALSLHVSKKRLIKELINFKKGDNFNKQRYNDFWQKIGDNF